LRHGCRRGDSSYGVAADRGSAEPHRPIESRTDICSRGSGGRRDNEHVIINCSAGAGWLRLGRQRRTERNVHERRCYTHIGDRNTQ
jgi:hypothetical protein